MITIRMLTGATALACATCSSAAGDAHVGPITDISVAAGAKVYSCSQGGIFEGTGDQLRLVHRPEFRVIGLAACEFDDNDIAPGLLLAGGQPGVSGSVGWRHHTGILFTHSVAKDTLYAIAISPDGNWVAAAGADGRVLVCEMNSDLAPENWSIRHKHTAAARAVAFSPDNKWLASAGLDGVVMISPVSGAAKTPPLHLTDHTSGVECLAFSPDSTSIASGSRDSKVRIHGVGGKLLRTFDGLGMADEPVAGRVPARVLSIAWGRVTLVAGTSKGTLHRLSQTDDQQSPLPRKGSDPITSLAFDQQKTSILLVGGRRLDTIVLTPG